MQSAFYILALLTIAGALGAMNFKRLVHCVLSLVVCFAGLAGLYLNLNAQFAGLVQLLVYVGAVAILVVFAMLLTRNAEDAPQNAGSTDWYLGLGVASMVFLILAFAVQGSELGAAETGKLSDPSVKAIGKSLMTTYVLPLEAMALLLTSALIGAVVIAKGPEEGGKP
ncbi:MAG: NADH-quinone oxidoreductase subunit J [Verrucomicrobiales bacterium]|nr:NADH-quinone oxidoreductase subunit J [Verrucomicrobiales bacterium]|tara:strand:- start:1236 stop:1739 length:504 start_codon:yes stop_codon:yes gene_type:complete